MRAEKLFQGVCQASGEVQNVVVRAQDVKSGDVYVCLAGSRFDGHDYASQALQNGAKYVVTSRDLGLPQQLIVDDERSAYAHLCKNLHNGVCDKMKIIAVTGTNGKTTVSHLIAHVLSKLGKKVGLIGTLGAFYDGKREEVGLTTPDPDVLHATFEHMYNAGVEYVVMEASAHAIALKKLDGIMFESAILTNVTQDHLDFFCDMESYAKTKLSFLSKQHCKCAIVCSDDKTARSLVDNDSVGVPVLSYGIENPSDCFAVYVDCSLQGSNFYVNCMDDIALVRSKLAGRFNVQNLLAAIVACQQQNFPLGKIAQSLASATPPEGRFQILPYNKGQVVIDYAHTPDGLEQLLKSVKKLSMGRVITVFGCGGNRDKTKRSKMGEVASKYSNFVVLTSDNPRDEKPQDIIDDIQKGVAGSFVAIENRKKAIEYGLSIIKKGDTLVIAGKGAENYQEIAGQKLPFKDKDVVLNCSSLSKHKVGDEND